MLIPVVDIKAYQVNMVKDRIHRKQMNSQSKDKWYVIKTCSGNLQTIDIHYSDKKKNHNPNYMNFQIIKKEVSLEHLAHHQHF